MVWLLQFLSSESQTVGIIIVSTFLGLLALLVVIVGLVQGREMQHNLGYQYHNGKGVRAWRTKLSGIQRAAVW